MEFFVAWFIISFFVTIFMGLSLSHLKPDQSPKISKSHPKYWDFDTIN